MFLHSLHHAFHQFYKESIQCSLHPSKNMAKVLILWIGLTKLFLSSLLAFNAFSLQFKPIFNKTTIIQNWLHPSNKSGKPLFNSAILLKCAWCDVFKVCAKPFPIAFHYCVYLTRHPCIVLISLSMPKNSDSSLISFKNSSITRAIKT